MANFPKLKLTNAGLELLANVQAGADTLTFTKTALGDGVTDAPVTSMTALVSKKIEVAITEGKQVGTSTYQIAAFFSNAEVTTGFWWREVGVFAKGNDGKEILYCYSNAGDASDYIPVGSDERVEKYIYQSFSIGNAENVTVEVDENDTFVLKKEFTEHKDATNPHGITAITIGLEKVPNVETNDQTPTYTEESTLTALKSGEKLSVAFGKIKKAITEFIAHLGNKSNPHGVTASQVGLGNVNNTSDANKPVSSAQAVAIADAKKSGTDAQSNLDTHSSDTTKHITATERTTWNGKANARHYHEPSDVGLGGITMSAENYTISIGAYSVANARESIQLGNGINNNANTLQVYDYQLMDANGKIPSERIKTLNVSVPKSWTANASGGYKQTIDVSGILVTDNPVVDIVLGDDVAANKLYLDAWGCIGSITTANGSITLYAYDNAPETAFTIKLKVV